MIEVLRNFPVDFYIKSSMYYAIVHYHVAVALAKCVVMHTLNTDVMLVTVDFVIFAIIQFIVEQCIPV